MRWRFVVLGLVAYGLGLLVLAPATLIDAALATMTGGQIRVAEARGTVWSGSGTIEFRAPSGTTGFGEPVAWRIAPQALLRGRLACDIRLNHDGQGIALLASPGRLELPSAVIRFPAALLGLVIPKLAPLELRGEMLLDVSHLVFGHGRTAGSATLDWRNAASVLVPVAPLGDYALRIDAQGHRLHANLTTLKGPVLLRGQGAWQPGSRPTLRATAIVPGQDRAQLSPLLRMIAVERAPGRFALQLD